MTSNAKTLPAIALMTIAAGCSTSKDAMPREGGMAVGWHSKHELGTADGSTVVAMKPISDNVRGGSPVAALAYVHIYKTNGDYSDYVPVTLNDSRDALVSYPAPSDLRDASPVKLDDGFLLDRRGVGVNTAFTRWTYAQYAAMKSAPTPDEIMNNLIPGARVTELYEMPFTNGTPDEAAKCNEMIKSGLKDCKALIIQIQHPE